MTPLEKERLTCALELAAVLQGLILTGTVPDYMVEYLQSRINRFDRAFGLPARWLTRKDIETDA